MRAFDRDTEQSLTHDTNPYNAPLALSGSSEHSVRTRNPAMSSNLLSMALFRAGELEPSAVELAELQRMVEADVSLQSVASVKSLFDEAVAMVGAPVPAEKS